MGKYNRAGQYQHMIGIDLKKKLGEVTKNVTEERK